MPLKYDLSEVVGIRQGGVCNSDPCLTLAGLPQILRRRSLNLMHEIVAIDCNWLFLGPFVVAA